MKFVGSTTASRARSDDVLDASYHGIGTTKESAQPVAGRRVDGVVDDLCVRRPIRWGQRSMGTTLGGVRWGQRSMGTTLGTDINGCGHQRTFGDRRQCKPTSASLGGRNVGDRRQCTGGDSPLGTDFSATGDSATGDRHQCVGDNVGDRRQRVDVSGYVDDGQTWRSSSFRDLDPSRSPQTYRYLQNAVLDTTKVSFSNGASATGGGTDLKPGVIGYRPRNPPSPENIEYQHERCGQYDARPQMGLQPPERHSPGKGRLLDLRHICLGTPEPARFVCP